MAEPILELGGTFDVVIIGAGVVGAAIARELGASQLRVALLEAGSDVGAGTSKANTSILHTGFDASPGTLEARLVRRGWGLLQAYSPCAGIPIERAGALMVAWSDPEVAALDEIEEKARSNGYDETRRVAPEELYRREPYLGPGALQALEVPGESIICTFTAPLAYATEAVENGVVLVLDCPVEGVARADDGYHMLAIPGGFVRASWVVNAAGLGSDVIDRMFGHAGFKIVPRRGELVVFDKLARPLVSHILLPVPTRAGKGVLVAPTVYGNVLLGPTAEDISDREATDSTAGGIDSLWAKGRRIVPALLDEEVTAVYAGLRAATEHSDYQFVSHPEQRYVCVGGIRSTGLSASMAIAEHVAMELTAAGVEIRPRPERRCPRMPSIGESQTRPFENDDAIAADPDAGRIVCHCERVTRAEIKAAVLATIGAATLDGLRRRTRAGMGRCQGFFCAAEVTALLATTAGRGPGELVGLSARSDDRPRVVVGGLGSETGRQPPSRLAAGPAR